MPNLKFLCKERWRISRRNHKADPIFGKPQRSTTLDPNKAKRLGRQIVLRADWEDVKVDLMGKIAREIKFVIVVNWL